MTTLNLGILAHVDAGKTTLTERLLYAAGVIDEIGSVDDGRTQTDSLALERQRGITIKSAVVSFAIGDLTVNLIDTPGHPDFIAEVERVLNVLDGAVLVISAVEGVQAQTRVLMRALRRLRIPTLIFVNKIDRLGARYEGVLREISTLLTPAIVPMGMVAGLGTRRGDFIACDASDAEFPALLADRLADQDDALLASYVDDETKVGYERLRAELVAQTRCALVHPVFFGSAMTGAGTGALTGGIRELLPAAAGDADGPPSGVVFKVERGPAGEKVAYVRMFSGEVGARDRVRFGAPGRSGEGKVTAVSVFSLGSPTTGSSTTGSSTTGSSTTGSTTTGSTTTGSTTTASTTTGSSTTGSTTTGSTTTGSTTTGSTTTGSSATASSVAAGQIGKLWGLPGIQIGDTICGLDGDVTRPGAASDHFPPPTLETVVEPRRPADRGTLHVALTRLAEQDPLINLRQDEARQELLLSLYGEVQKEVIQATLASDFGLEAGFRESTTICVERPAGTGAAAEFLKQPSNPFLATVGLRVEPAPAHAPAHATAGAPAGPTAGATAGVSFRLEPALLGTMPPAFFTAVEETVHQTLAQGLFGWQVIDCAVVMTHSGYYPRQSHAHAHFDKSMSSTAGDFRQLTPLVLMSALRQAGTRVHEPVHRFCLEIPADTAGAVLPAAARLRAVVRTSVTRGASSLVEGDIPAAQVHQFQRLLPGLTRGEGLLEAAFDRYEPVVGPPPARPRSDDNPLDRKEYLLRILRRVPGR
ncbi:MAG TPA: translation factor GTPase family protein [Streptosporangiaceae bacterium]|nr:translation factor GTPase family protein [Streptosporangiaceae bacterium]